MKIVSTVPTVANTSSGALSMLWVRTAYQRALPRSPARSPHGVRLPLPNRSDTRSRTRASNDTSANSTPAKTIADRTPSRSRGFTVMDSPPIYGQGPACLIAIDVPDQIRAKQRHLSWPHFEDRFQTTKFAPALTKVTGGHRCAAVVCRCAAAGQYAPQVAIRLRTCG